MDGLNDYRTARVAEILDDFRTLQYYIAAAPTEPPNTDDHYTEGWAALRQCAIDGQHILECAADTSVPTPDGGEEEQRKAELKQVYLDAYARRHEGQKIYLRQGAAQRWIEYREHTLNGSRPNSKNRQQLEAFPFHPVSIFPPTEKKIGPVDVRCSDRGPIEGTLCHHR
jgi:hypothetical protein